MNVLVYTGPGTSSDGNAQMIAGLRELLEPHYAVAPVTEAQLLEEPWAKHCSLLVIPGGADLPYCRALNGTGNDKIKQYVRKGGRFLGVCAGAYFSSGRCEFELGTENAVAGPRELAFFPGTARGACFKRYEYGSAKGAHAAIIQGSKDTGLGLARVYVNGGPYFDLTTIRSEAGVKVLASYTEDVNLDDAGKGLPAIIQCELGRGKVVLSGPHIEWSAARVVDRRNMDPEEFLLAAASEQARKKMFAQILLQLDLKVTLPEDGKESGVAPPTAPKLTPIFAAQLQSGLKPDLSSLKAAVQPLFEANTSTVMDSNDTLEFIESSALLSPRTSLAQSKNEEGQGEPLTICVCETLPDPKATPNFSLPLYFKSLAEAESEFKHKGPSNNSSVGRLVLYGEVVNSTSTMLERNPKLLAKLPHGVLTVGTKQLQGRGRGGNVWVNPVGVLAVSGVLRVPTSALQHPLVFVQYLVSLAVVEAVQTFAGYENLYVKLKWPNDIYIKAPSTETETGSSSENEWKLTKIGGVLVSVSVIDGDYVVVFGSGTNVSNAAPTTSLNVVAEAYNKLHNAKLKPLTREELLSRVAVKLDELWGVFVSCGFRPIEPRYYRSWLHSEQVVHLENMGNARAQISGISPETGMLIAHEVDRQDRRSGSTYELQPDGNSFDMFEGLIRRKQ